MCRPGAFDARRQRHRLSQILKVAGIDSRSSWSQSRAHHLMVVVTGHTLVNGTLDHERCNERRHRIRGPVQQHIVLALKIHQAGQILHRGIIAVFVLARHRQTVADDNGKKPVIIPHHQFGIVDVHFPGMSQQVNVVFGGKNLIDD